MGIPYGDAQWKAERLHLEKAPTAMMNREVVIAGDGELPFMGSNPVSNGALIFLKDADSNPISNHTTLAG